jgi:hypothetical protein
MSRLLHRLPATHVGAISRAAAGTRENGRFGLPVAGTRRRGYKGSSAQAD